MIRSASPPHLGQGSSSGESKVFTHLQTRCRTSGSGIRKSASTRSTKGIQDRSKRPLLTKTTGKPDDFPEFGQRRNSGSAGAHPLLRAGTPAQERSPDLLAVLGSSLSFVNAGLMRSARRLRRRSSSFLRSIFLWAMIVLLKVKNVICG